MSWVPPYLAKPNCAQCANGKHTGITVAILDQPAFALRECGLHDERRYWFRKNPPMPDMGNGGADCKRYCPQQAASHKLGDDWVEFPAITNLERTRKPKRQRNPHEQENPTSEGLRK